MNFFVNLFIAALSNNQRPADYEVYRGAPSDGFQGFWSLSARYIAGGTSYPLHCFCPLVSPCGSRCGSNRNLCVKETTDGLRRHIPFGRFSLIIDSGDFLNESLLLLAGFRPRHAEFPAHRKKDTINKRSKLHRPHLLSSIPQSLQKIKWQIEAAAVTLFVLKTHRCNQKAAAAFLLHFQSSLAVFLDFNSFSNILRPEFPMCSTHVCGILCGQRQSLARVASVMAL